MEFKLYKNDGTEVNFTTEEGMLKTLKAFPDKYCMEKFDTVKKEIEKACYTGNASIDEKITEKEIEDLIVEKVEDEVFESNEVLEEE